MSSGDHINVSGSVFGSVGGQNITNTFDNISQTITSMPNASQADKENLAKLVQQLNTALQQAPKERQEDAEAVADTAKDLVDKAAKGKPNKASISITAEGLKAAAANLKDVIPDVLSIASLIVTSVMKLVG